MNKNGSFRKKKLNFSMISNSIIRDETISLKAKGLYALIQSYITLDSFVLYKDFLMSKCCEGKKAFDAAWKELKDSGYLVQFRCQDDKTKQFYWEYELLDEPCQTLQNEEDSVEAIPPKGIVWQRDGMDKGCDGKGGHINNTIHNNTLNNNTNQIISIDDVMDKIGINTFKPADFNQVMEIAILITDVMNTDDSKRVRINSENIPSPTVKERFRGLNQFHVEYVLDCLRQNGNKIGNMKNYLLTALYNAPATMNLYYQNKVNSYTGG